MPKYSIEDTTLTGIGDAIREKTGVTEVIPVSEMRQRILGIEAGGGSGSGGADTSDATLEATGVTAGMIGYGAAGKVVGTSPFKYDGIESTGDSTTVSVTLPVSGGIWRATGYGAGMFVALKSDSNIAIYLDKASGWAQVELPVTAKWYDVAYGNGRFVAVATGTATAAISTDGTAWETVTLPAEADWQSIAYGDGKFVAIAYSSDVAAYSYDGISWTAFTMPVSTVWYGLTYGNGVFVALVAANASTKAYYSVNGLDWVKTTMPTAKWYSVTHGGGMFVAVAYGINGADTAVAAYSKDGVNWVETTLPYACLWCDVTYSDGVFVAVPFRSGGAATDAMAYSVDGVTWSAATVPTASNWLGVEGGGGNFVALSANAYRAYASADGANWSTEITLPVEYKPVYKVTNYLDKGILLGADGCEDRTLLVADNRLKFADESSGGGSGGTDTSFATAIDKDIMKGIIAYGKDGKLIGDAPFNYVGGEEVSSSEETIALPRSTYWYTVTCGNGRFVALSCTTAYAAYSDDGFTWHEVKLPVSGYWYHVTYGNGRFVSVDMYNSDVAIYSDDGITWYKATLPTADYWRVVGYGNGRFVAITSSNSNVAAYSEDGVTWTQTTMPAKTYWSDVTYSGNRFVAVSGHSGNTSSIAAYSDDGINWVETALPAEGQYDCAYGNGIFVAVSAINTTGAYSTDGVTWTATEIPYLYLNGVTYGNGRFVSISSYGSGATDSVIYSDDGIHWTSVALATTKSWYDITFGNDRFVAIAHNSTAVCHSHDGANWFTTATVIENAYTYEVTQVDNVYMRGQNGRTRLIVNTEDDFKFSDEPEAIDTSDATITDKDVMSGEVAYGKDGQVVGSAPFTHVSDDTYECIGAPVLVGSNGETRQLVNDGTDFGFTDEEDLTEVLAVQATLLDQLDSAITQKGG